ncbi:unnamed protein product [Nesidiocoris tenuis]|uniref:J domain-containing protein n=1 Tax=Nesidiocoris tenuis TaxID=355587 RepID=A0A6H5GN98_9HEMI|nr:unnamed protein product [Nesidiocoris tenuis]CAB0005494.1 unnamed protein product [Nesidiocoris tenuis]
MIKLGHNFTFQNMEASQEEIVNAYRRLSKLFHPDKHTDPIRKREAEFLFNKVKQAYEVLKDPHQRAIYDSVGVKGLETEGWEIIQRTKTPAEIRDEYDRLARQREERRLQQRTNPKGSVTVNVNAVELFNPYEDGYEDELAGTFGAEMSYGAEKKISEQSTVAATIVIGVPSGVTLRLRLSRASQNYLMPIQLCDEVLPSPIFYATIAPLLTYAIVKKLVIDPIVNEEKATKRQRQKETYRNRMAEKKKEARAAVDLMSNTFARIRAEEEARRGLVIVSAEYGKLELQGANGSGATGDPNLRRQESDDMGPPEPEHIDVTVPLQCLVKDSKLIVHDSTKSQLAGFYDPCVGEDKHLRVQYLFHSQLHETTIADNEALRIPRQCEWNFLFSSRSKTSLVTRGKPNGKILEALGNSGKSKI